MRRLKLLVLLLLAGSLPFQSGCRSAPNTVRQTESHSPSASGQIELVFSYGSEKQKWIEDVTATFNQSSVRTSSGKTIQVKAIPKGSGECIDDVLSGTEQDDLTSPASNVFIKLGNAKSRAASGQVSAKNGSM